MCLIVLAWEVHPEYKLIFASNRDEFYNRPSLPLNFWEDKSSILAGRDAKAGGTWLGVNKSGKLSAITNYRDPSIIKENPPSRGELTTNFLISDLSSYDYLKSIQPNSKEYNGFNLLMYDNETLCFYSNVENKIKKLPPGIYGLSNHLLDTPWPKVKNLKQNFKEVLENNKFNSPLSLSKELFEILKNDIKPKDEELPQTGVSLEWERAVAPIFIKSEVYGTSSSAVILLNRNDEMIFTERRYGKENVDDLSFDIQLS